MSESHSSTDRSEFDGFTKAINKSPIFLLLGQKYLSLESGIDPFLSGILDKYGSQNQSRLHYGSILESEANKSVEDSLSWMQEFCGHISAPDWLKTVSSFAWSGVYTSAIDIVWPKAFRTNWRELYHIFDERNNPPDSRNKLKLHCTYLFGNVGRSEERERPPLTKMELLSRAHVATALARRLPEAVTPFGLLIIEGYAGNVDWFSPGLLLPIVNQLNPGQTHVFSVSDEIFEDPLFRELVQNGKITLHRDSLASFLLMAEDAGIIKLGVRPESNEQEGRIRIADRVVSIPADVWNRTSVSATIIDDSILVPPPHLSEEKRYLEFRNFLAESSISPVWDGFEQGFAFRRNYQSLLNDSVEETLKEHGLQKEPIILHGQTGTGKTVALATLAYDIRKQGKYPVLFIERKPQLPSSSDIDSFCKWAEDSGASASLVVWDGMFDNSTLDQYYDLLKYLAGRGRKVVLVGSCYHLDANKYSGKNFVTAPAQLSNDEIFNFHIFLEKVDPSISKFIKEHTAYTDDSFLVSLYRLLPATRSQIRSGINKEVIANQREIERTLQTKRQIEVNSLVHALVESGVITEADLIEEKVSDQQDKTREMNELIGLIIVPGRFGLKIPLGLILRATGKNGFVSLVSLLDRIDFVRVSTDDIGNIWVAPRHPLEAKLLSQVRLGGARGEIPYVERLLVETKESTDSANNLEVQFAVNLLHNVGPNGPDSYYFSQYYLELSNTLKKLREERGVQNPRLMLQEATFVREFVVDKSKKGQPPENALQEFDGAQKTLRDALRPLESDRRNSKMRSVILVELASNLGSKGVYMIEQLQLNKEAIPLFQEARRILLQARELDPNSYYPIDVIAWTTSFVLKTNTLTPQAAADAKADLIHIFEMTEAEDFGIKQQERYLMRLMKVGELIKREDLSEQAFEALVSKGSSAGYYLKAYSWIKDLPRNSELDPSNRNIGLLLIALVKPSNSLRSVEL